MPIVNCPIECLKETVQAPVRTINAALVIDDSDGKLSGSAGLTSAVLELNYAYLPMSHRVVRGDIS